MVQVNMRPRPAGTGTYRPSLPCPPSRALRQQLQARAESGNGASSSTALPDTEAPQERLAPPAEMAGRDTASSSGLHDAQALKLQLLSQCAGTDRGRSTNLVRRRHIKQTIRDLTDVGKPVDIQSGQPAPIDGEWELLYATTEAFRSSPFFWAFQKGLVQDIDLAGAIFAFTDSIPGATVGRAVQHVDLAAGQLVSSVRLTVFPGLTGNVVTQCSASGQGRTLKLVVQSTSVPDSNLFPFLDNVSVPVQQLVERVRGAGTTAVEADVLYLDADMRVMRTYDGQMFVYGRV